TVGPGEMPGSRSSAVLYTPSLSCATLTCPRLPLLASGMNEMYPAGTGCPLNVTVPESCPNLASLEQPAAIPRIVTKYRGTLSRKRRIGRGSIIPVAPRSQAVLRVADDRPRGGADGRADRTGTAVRQGGDHHVAVQRLQPAVVAAGGQRVSLNAAGVD